MKHSEGFESSPEKEGGAAVRPLQGHDCEKHLKRLSQRFDYSTNVYVGGDARFLPRASSDFPWQNEASAS